jgi:hypothetical protein
MIMLDTATMNQLVLDAFTGKITWLAASSQYPLDDFIEAFFNTRAAMQRTIDGMSDAQVAYAAPEVATWPLSDTVTHLIYSQNFYHNHLLEITSSTLPHIVEAAKGFGEGAIPNQPAAWLSQRLSHATDVIRECFARTRPNFDPKRTSFFAPFGECNYATWTLLLLGHEIDHVRQAILMRRVAKRAIPDPTDPKATQVLPLAPTSELPKPDADKKPSES